MLVINTDIVFFLDVEIYTNVPVTTLDAQRRLIETQFPVDSQCHCAEQPLQEPAQPLATPYMMSMVAPHNMVYTMPHINPDIPVTVPQCNPVSMMTPYGAVPYYYPVQAPYMIPTPVYAPIKHANTMPVNGYPPMPQYNRYPSVPTAQLIELDAPSVYENGKFERHPEERSHRRSKASTSKRPKSSFSDASLPSLPRSDTQPTLSKAKEDGMGTYESWDYVFRNLSSKENDHDSRSGFSQSLDRDSRTLDRLDREERRSKYQPTTLDLEDGLQALNLDRTYDEDMYRTAKVNENLMRLKLEQESKRARQLAKKQLEERRPKKTIEPIGNPTADGLVTPKVAPDKMKLLTKKEIKDRKDVIKQQNSVNGSISGAVEVKKVKKPTRLVAVEVEKTRSKPVENGVHKSNSSISHSSNNLGGKHNIFYRSTS